MNSLKHNSKREDPLTQLTSGPSKMNGVALDSVSNGAHARQTHEESQSLSTRGNTNVVRRESRNVAPQLPFKPTKFVSGGIYNAGHVSEDKSPISDVSMSDAPSLVSTSSPQSDCEIPPPPPPPPYPPQNGIISPALQTNSHNSATPAPNQTPTDQVPPPKQTPTPPPASTNGMKRKRPSDDPRSGEGGGMFEFGNDKMRRVMMKSGWDGSRGLGREEQGRREPVQAYQKRIRGGGLGFVANRGSEMIDEKVHVYEETPIEVIVEVKWVSKNDCKKAIPLPQFDDMKKWLRTTTTPEAMDGNLCDIGQQEELRRAKSYFDFVDPMAFKEARNRANPYEQIGNEGFLNRAAIKIAELDAICNRKITNPPNLIYKLGDSVDNEHVYPLSKKKREREVVHYADICAGPGGWSEYILCVHRHKARCHGFTLKGENDFTPDKFCAGSFNPSFKAHYGSDGTGDITNTKNMEHFRDAVMKDTDGQGVHVAMCDGGFSVSHDNEYNRQEFLHRQLIMCEVAVSMSILRKGGVLVLKLFDTVNLFTVSLLYLLFIHFDSVALVKPNQSRPANSEKYAICDGFHPNPDIVDYLYQVNDIMNAEKANGQYNITCLVKGKTVFKKHRFVKYMYDFNASAGARQIDFLERTRHYLEDRSLRTDNQYDIRRKYVEFIFNSKHVRFNTNAQRPVYVRRACDEVSSPKRLENLLSPETTESIRDRLRYSNRNQRLLDGSDLNWLKQKRDKILCFVFPRSDKLDAETCYGRCLIVSDRSRKCYVIHPENGTILGRVKGVRLPRDTIIDAVRWKDCGFGLGSPYIYFVLDSYVIGSEMRYHDSIRKRIDYSRMLCEAVRHHHMKFLWPLTLDEFSQSEVVHDVHKDKLVFFVDGKLPGFTRVWDGRRSKLSYRTICRSC